MDRGIVVLLANDFEGLIPASKISDSIDNYKVDDSFDYLISMSF